MKLLVTIIVIVPCIANAEPAQRRTTVAFDPIALVGRAYALSVAHAVTGNAALRGDIEYRPAADGYPMNESWRATIGVPLYLDHAFSGPFVEPGIIARRDDYMGYGAVGALGAISEHPISPPVTLGIEALVGWQWSFHERYTIAGAVGASREWGPYGGPPQVVGVSQLRVGLVF